MASDTSSSAGTDPLDFKNEEGWEDVEPDTENLIFISLFDDHSFSSSKEMLEYCKTKYDFDISQVRKDLDLDYLNLIQLINYIRSEVKSGNSKPDVSAKKAFDNEKYLKPVLEDDALLFSLDDVEYDHDLQNGDHTNNELQNLQEELATLQSQFNAYREEVQKSLLQKIENEKELPGGPPAASGQAQSTAKDQSQSNQEDGYFQSYSYNSIHEIMLKDKVRTDAYRDFIYDNKQLFKDKIVLDVGCGTGILSMFCAKAGAKLVIAVDNSNIIEKTRENVFNNGLQDIVKCLRGKIEEVTLPVPKVDIIVSEWMGYCLLYESMLDSVICARDKYLAPDGLMVPSHSTIRIAPLADSDLKASHIDFWHDVYGFDMTPMLEKAHEEVLIRVADKDELAAEASTFLELDLHKTTVSDLSFTMPFSLAWKNGFQRLEGFVIWFDIFFGQSRESKPVQSMSVNSKGHPAGATFFSTGPASEPTHWQQGILLIQDPKDKLVANDKLQGQITYCKLSGRERSLNVDLKWSKNDEKEVTQSWILD